MWWNDKYDTTYSYNSYYQYNEKQGTGYTWITETFCDFQMQNFYSAVKYGNIPHNTTAYIYVYVIVSHNMCDVASSPQSYIFQVL